MVAKNYDAFIHQRMGDPLTLFDNVDGSDKWVCTLLRCGQCGKQWVAVHPSCKTLQCPACGVHTIIPEEGGDNVRQH